MSPSNEPGFALESLLGPLERRVLEATWERGGPVTVRELLPALGGVAYTTAMTTLDRLHRKGFLVREKAGRGFVYAAAWSRDELASHLIGSALSSLMPADPGSIRPLLSTFVEEVGRRDASLLDELERELRRRRQEGT
jgi:predicted transcriptional regulator